MEGRKRVVWKLECVDKCFIEACLHEVATNGREGGGLKGNSWKVVGEKLKNEHNFVVDQKQMKNRYDYLKGKYLVWLKLKNKTGNIYDPVSNTFNLTEEEWQAEMKLSKYAEKLRSVPLVFPNLLTQLFDGAAATGFQSWGPSSRVPRPVAEDVNNHVFDDVFDETRMDETPTPMDEIPPPTPLDQTPMEPASPPPKKGTKRKSKEDGNKLDTELLQVGQQMTKVASAIYEATTLDNNIDACMEKLEKLEWGEDDPRYETAILLFAESVDVRKVWCSLKMTSCESWVFKMGRKYGFLE